MKNKLDLGKIDYENTGTAQNAVEITWELRDGRFSAQGGIWNKSHRDYLSCGQNLDEIAELFPDNEKVQKIHQVWKEWHLNDMTAGSPRQETFVKKLKQANQPFDYDTIKQKLTDAGLDPDPEFIYKGTPYSYGSAWLMRELPAEIIEEIESWSN